MLLIIRNQARIFIANRFVIKIIDRHIHMENTSTRGIPQLGTTTGSFKLDRFGVWKSNSF